ARHRLFMMHVTVRRIWGTANYADASRFFLEIPADLIDLRDYTQALGGSRTSFAAPPPRRSFGSSSSSFSSEDDFDQTPRYSETPRRGGGPGDLVGRKLR